MQKLDASGKTVTLKVRYKNFETVTRSYSHPQFIHKADDISETAVRLLEETEAGAREVRLLGISISSLNLHKGGSFGEQLEFPFRKVLI